MIENLERGYIAPVELIARRVGQATTAATS
jgi:hypothetical protein